MQVRSFAFAFVITGAACSQSTGDSLPIVSEPVWHLEMSSRVVAGEPGAAAIAYLADQPLGLSAEEDLEVISVIAGADRLQHIRIQESHRGLPVLGSEIAVHADQTTFVAYGGTVTRNLEGFEVVPAIDGDRALELARAHMAPAMEPVREARRLAIQPGDGGGAMLVWQVEILADGQAGVEPGRWFALVDAASGEVVESYNGLATAEQASGPGGNPKAPHDWAAELDVEPAGGVFAMQTERFTTLDFHRTMDTGLVVVGPLDPIGDPAINDAHGFAEVTLDMMREWMGYDSIDDRGFPIVSRVHYDQDYGNAFWNGEAMTYGDGGDRYFPLSGALDVVAHEINHGFTEKHSNLEYKKEPGGLNESFSDVAGALAEFYFLGEEADFLVGEDVRRDGSALRTMCDPPADGHSIDHVRDFDPGFYIEHVRIWGTDVHYSSGLGNKAFCLAVGRYVATGASVLDSVRWMGQVWYLANAAYWTSGASFEQGCQGTVDAAHALGFSRAAIVAIQQSWADVGVLCGSGDGLACQVDATCDAAAGESCFSCASDCGSCTESCSLWKKAKCKLGIGDCSKCSDAAGCGDGECGEDEDDETCGIDCGCRAPEDACGSVAPYGCWCDPGCAEAGDCCADAEVCG
jgi:pseudolysin/vibriolysin